MGYHGRKYSTYTDNRDIKKGDIYYVCANSKTAYEDGNGRPAVVVSGDKVNNTSDFITVIYVSADATESPIHVPFSSGKIKGYFKCETLVAERRDRFVDFVRICNDDEMDAIDSALKIALELQDSTPALPAPITHEVIKEVKIPVPAQTGSGEELLRAQTERDVYKTLYTELLKKFTAL